MTKLLLAERSLHPPSLLLLLLILLLRESFLISADEYLSFFFIFFFSVAVYGYDRRSSFLLEIVTILSETIYRRVIRDRVIF